MILWCFLVIQTGYRQTQKICKKMVEYGYRLFDDEELGEAEEEEKNLEKEDDEEPTEEVVE